MENGNIKYKFKIKTKINWKRIKCNRKRLNYNKYKPMRKKVKKRKINTFRDDKYNKNEDDKEKEKGNEATLASN
jgi:hypothetical protein